KKILIVGSGGIGCELLKNLVVTGFVDIHIVDLDTIELSNLNRQFLFRQSNIGQPKAIVAKRRSENFCRDARITAHHGNIKDARFGTPFFQKFDLIINALDNLPTRRHVNRICVALGKPLIESGTQGYSGQVYLIKKGFSECYECVEKMAPKTFPVCTIRDTPEKPVHCIAWAKMMFGVLFASDEIENSEMSDMKMAKREDENGLEYARRLYEFLFERTILDRLEAIKLKENFADSNGKKPVPLKLSDFISESKNGFLKENGLSEENGLLKEKGFSKILKKKDLLENLSNGFLAVVEKILKDGNAFHGFDKDDGTAMDFVHFAANLRMANYGIDTISRFKAKGIAGNIVHAIATTNAICAGLMAIEAWKVLIAQNLKKCQRSWIQLNYAGSRIIQPEALSPPSKKCIVCSKQSINMVCNTRVLTLRELFDDVLKEKLGMVEPVVDVTYGSHANFISEDISDWDGNEKWMADYFQNPLSREAIKINHGSMLTVSDDKQKFTLKIMVSHQLLFEPFFSCLGLRV
ncbi:hypothetical protein MHBO_001294, partial [Bonamia ostreae]